MNIPRIFHAATGGHKTVPDEWVSATALRPLLQDDPCLVWLKHHGDQYGFKKDSGPYQFLDFIGEVGRKFEDKWLTEVAPEAVVANEEDHDVRRAVSVERTLRLMAERRPVIAKAALWWEPTGTYGTADLIALRSWLVSRFPQLAPHVRDDGPDHYVVLDCKFKTGLDTPRKKKSLRLDAVQVQLYSFMLGHLQSVVPSHAFIVCRDRPFDPLPVAVGHELGAPLDEEITDLIATHRWIVKHGARVTPWTCPLVRPNFASREDAPWSGAKKAIITERWPHTPLETLPYIGSAQAVALTAIGLRSTEEILKREPDELDLEGLPNVGASRASLIRALLKANRSGQPTVVPSDAVPIKRRTELFVDFEFLSNVNVDMVRDWPELRGREMVFAIGVGWESNDGGWQYRQLVAEAQTPDAERQMWDDFLRLLRGFGFSLQPDPDESDSVIYHWSPAERVQVRRAAERHGLSKLANLPWLDLRESFTRGEIALPGHWGFGLKEVARAVGEWSPDHAVVYPDGLGEGLSAMVAGWRAYEQTNALNTREMNLIGQYLEADCQSLWAVLRWLRSAASPPSRSSSLTRASRCICRYTSSNPLLGLDRSASNWSTSLRSTIRSVGILPPSSAYMSGKTIPKIVRQKSLTRAQWT